MQLFRGQDAPVEAVCSASKGVSDDPARRSDATRMPDRWVGIPGCAIHGHIAEGLRRRLPARGASPGASGWSPGVATAAAGHSSTRAAEADTGTTNTP